MVNTRIGKLIERLEANSLDGLIVACPYNRRYLSGFSGSNGLLLISSSVRILATDFRYYEQAEAEAGDYTLFKTNNGIDEWFGSLISELKPDKLGFESKHVSFATFTSMKKAIKKAGLKTQLVSTKGMVEALRSLKDKAEIECINKAVSISDEVINHLVELAEPGMTEIGLAWEIEKYMRQAGSQTFSFEVICASGPNSALPHAKPSNRVIRVGEPVVIDLGARIDGYTSDITRTICFGKPDSYFKKLYNIVYSAQQAAINGIVAGMSASDADSLARNIIEREGYGQNFGHGLGHGIGLDVHESPTLNPSSLERLEAGMVFTVEPGIYVPDWGGIRIEDDALLLSDRLEVLTSANKLEEI